MCCMPHSLDEGRRKGQWPHFTGALGGVGWGVRVWSGVTDDSEEEEEAVDVLNRWMSHLDTKGLNVSDH